MKATSALFSTPFYPTASCRSQSLHPSFRVNTLCLLQVINASSLTHCLNLDTLKLPQTAERKRKSNLKIAFGLDFFFQVNGCSTLTLVQPPSMSPFLHSLIPCLAPFSPCFIYNARRRVIDGNSGDLWNFHTHSHHFPHRLHLSFTSCPPALT